MSKESRKPTPAARAALGFVRWYERLRNSAGVPLQLKLPRTHTARRSEKNLLDLGSGCVDVLGNKRSREYATGESPRGNPCEFLLFDLPDVQSVPYTHELDSVSHGRRCIALFGECARWILPRCVV